jgi:diphthamide biosynthesis protein 2
MTEQTAPPVLSTPDIQIFEDPTPISSVARPQRLDDQELRDVYEIQRTAEEVKAGGWRRIALQFPDGMLHDATRVFEDLQATIHKLPARAVAVEDHLQELDITKRTTPAVKERLFILADTSYGACCVDEIAAEHVDADVVIHYGRSCLSPTARLPVIYVYTSQSLEVDEVVRSFQSTFPETDRNVILMADITYNNHVPVVLQQLQALGYTNIFSPEIIHDPSSLLPNRTAPPSATIESLKSYHLFHISSPPPALLLTLSSRLASLHIHSTDSSNNALEAKTSRLLMRRYALLTSLSTCPIFGILINTLSVKNYLPTITRIQAQIAAAGKKSYTFVVGKVNAAKVANFSEIGGWIVVGCWESSLIESSDFFRPIITPFELGLALQSDEERLWTGEWRGDFSSLADAVPVTRERQATNDDGEQENGEIDDDDDSAPPEFDLRTGRYVSHSRPMRNPAAATTGTMAESKPESTTTTTSSSSLIKRANGDLAMINGTASPGAEYLRSQRTWKGLGSDFEIKYEDEEGAQVEEGRSGVARGYTVGEGGRM